MKNHNRTNNYILTISLATFDGEIVDTEIAEKLEMWDVLKVHNVQT